MVIHIGMAIKCLEWSELELSVPARKGDSLALLPARLDVYVLTTFKLATWSRMCFIEWTPLSGTRFKRRLGLRRYVNKRRLHGRRYSCEGHSWPRLDRTCQRRAPCLGRYFVKRRPSLGRLLKDASR